METVNNSNWMSYYDGRRSPVPPPRGAAAESKTCCGAPILALLGLLALGGLIAAIVLGAKGADSTTDIAHDSSSQGIPIKEQP